MLLPYVVFKLGTESTYMITFIRWFGRILLGLAVLVIVVGYIGIWWTEGFGALQDTLSPSNFWNYIAVIITLAPGFGLIQLAGWLERRNNQ